MNSGGPGNLVGRAFGDFRGVATSVRVKLRSGGVGFI